MYPTQVQHRRFLASSYQPVSSGSQSSLVCLHRTKSCKFAKRRASFAPRTSRLASKVIGVVAAARAATTSWFRSSERLRLYFGLDAVGCVVVHKLRADWSGSRPFLDHHSA